MRNASKLQTITGLVGLVLLFAWAVIVKLTDGEQTGMSTDLWTLMIGASAWLLPQPLKKLPPTLNGNGPDR